MPKPQWQAKPPPHAATCLGEPAPSPIEICRCSVVSTPPVACTAHLLLHCVPAQPHALLRSRQPAHCFKRCHNSAVPKPLWQAKCPPPALPWSGQTAPYSPWEDATIAGPAHTTVANETPPHAPTCKERPTSCSDVVRTACSSPSMRSRVELRRRRTCIRSSRAASSSCRAGSNACYSQ